MTYTQQLDDLDALTGSIGARFALRYRYDGMRARATVDAETRTLITSTSGYGSERTEPSAPAAPSRPVRFLAETIPTVPVDVGRVTYIEEIDTSSGAASASAVPEAGTKPEIPVTFKGQESPVGKVDAYVNVTDDLLDDAPGLRDYIDRRLMLHLLAAQDRDLVASFVANPDVLTQAYAVSVLATLTDAAGKVENALGAVTGIGMHPLDYWAMVKANLTTSAIDQDAGTVLGVPVVRSKGVPQGKALVGDLLAGAVIRERDTSVRFSQDHASNFVENKMTLLAERRYLLVVNAPQAFAVAALS